MQIHHEPVLLNFFRDYLAKFKSSQIILDGTLGEGGHSQAFLEAGHVVYALERDETILAKAKKRLSDFKGNFFPKLGNFSSLDKHFPVGLNFDFILLDLGISKFHYFESGRGFSFMKNEPLNMRLDLEPDLLNDKAKQSEGKGLSRNKNGNKNRNKIFEAKTATELINFSSKEELIKIFTELGEESFFIAKKCVEIILEKRKQQPITKTFQLNEIIKEAYGKKAKYQKIHPSTKIFQAIRIYLNQEFHHLELGLGGAVLKLAPGGILFVITYHSLEDRIVKNIFNSLVKKHENYNKYKKSEVLIQKEKEKPFVLYNKKVLLPSLKEIKANPAARSAKLRGIKKVL